MMFKKSIMLLAGLFIVAGFASGYGQAEDSSFDETQTEELHQIIRDYLVQNPEVIAEALEALQLKQEEQELVAFQNSVRENANDIFRSELDHVMGNPYGDVTMVEFFDYNCGYCKRSLDDVQALIDADPELRMVFKEFPILGPGSMAAARAAIASRQQGLYWEFHIALMQSAGIDGEASVIRIAEEVGLDTAQLLSDMESPEVDTVIDLNYRLAELMGIQGTPAFLVDDRLIPGALGFAGLQSHISEVRDSGVCIAC